MRLLLGLDEKTCSLVLALLLRATFLIRHSQLASYKMEICVYYIGKLFVP